MAITNGDELVEGEYYAEHGPPHDIWTRLRQESPVHRCEPTRFEPFWAITKHADIIEISTQPELFRSEPGIVLLDNIQEAAVETSALSMMRVIIMIDPPEHREVRKVSSHVFTSKAVRALDDVIERSAREVVDQLASEGGVQAGSRSSALRTKNASTASSPRGLMSAAMRPMGSVPPSGWGKSVENA
jgi:cytochrome P450